MTEAPGTLHAFHAEPAAIRAHAATVADAGAVVATVAVAAQPESTVAAFGRIAEVDATVAFDAALATLHAGLTRAGTVLQQTAGGLITAAATYERAEQTGTDGFRQIGLAR